MDGLEYGGSPMANSEYAGLPLVFTCYLFMLDDLTWRRDHVGAPDTLLTRQSRVTVLGRSLLQLHMSAKNQK